LFTLEFPGSGWRGHSVTDGGLDLCNFARRTEIDDDPTPAPAVYDAFLLLLWVSPIKVYRTRLNIYTII
jgi:hypothetical protein